MRWGIVTGLELVNEIPVALRAAKYSQSVLIREKWNCLRLIKMLKYQDYKSIKDLMELHNAGESAIKMRLKRAKEKLLGVYNVVYCQALL